MFGINNKRDDKEIWKMRYLFLDESGDLGFADKSSKHFVITILSCDEKDIKHLRNIPKKIRTRKLKKKYKVISELKANNCNDPIREVVLTKVNKLNIEIYTIIVFKEKVFDYLRDKKHKLYNYIAKLIITECTISDDKAELIVDKLGNMVLAEEFTEYINREFNSRNNHCNLSITHSDSKNDNGLQVVDFVSWAIFRKYERGQDYFYNIIKNRITIEKKLYDKN